MKWTYIIIVCCFILTNHFSTTIHAAEFQGLGSLNTVDGYCIPYDISGDGQTIVGQCRLASENRQSKHAAGTAFIWTRKTGLRRIGEIPGEGLSSIALGTNTDGSIVVGKQYLGDQAIAFVWTEIDELAEFGGFSDKEIFQEASAVSSDGRIIVGSGSSPAGKEAYRWISPGRVETMGDLEGGYFWNNVHALSDNGKRAVGASSSELGIEAFLWEESFGMLGLSDLQGGKFSSEAYSISADGSTIVGLGSSSFGAEAFRWTKDTGMEGLGDLPGGKFGSWAFDVSGDGTIVVGWSMSDVSEQNGMMAEAFIWDQNRGIQSLRDLLVRQYGLDLRSWQLEKARAISDDGLTIVGDGINPRGKPEGWMVYLGSKSEDEEPETIDISEVQEIIEEPTKPQPSELEELINTDNMLETEIVRSAPAPSVSDKQQEQDYQHVKKEREKRLKAIEKEMEKREIDSDSLSPSPEKSSPEEPSPETNIQPEIETGNLPEIPLEDPELFDTSEPEIIAETSEAKPQEQTSSSQEDDNIQEKIEQYEETLKEDEPVNFYPFYEKTIHEIPNVKSIQGILVMTNNHPAIPCFELVIGDKKHIEDKLGFALLNQKLEHSPNETDLSWIDVIHQNCKDVEKDYSMVCAEDSRLAFITEEGVMMIQICKCNEAFVCGKDYRSTRLKETLDELFMKHNINF